MTRECHVRFREGGGVRFPSATRRLAKALGDPETDNPAESPTLTAAATCHGVVVGTAAYMAPEQARGTPVDRRADIWAFGVVLYEMVTGQRPFDRGTVSDTMAAVLRDAVDEGALPSEIPDGMRRLIRRCVHKDRAERLQHIGDARVELSELVLERRPIALPVATRQPSSRRTVVRVAAILAGLAIAVMTVLVVNMMLELPAGATIDSVAVLPFDNVGGDPESEYLADGITQSVINTLSGLEQLRVRPWSTTARYKGRAVDLEAAGTELSVGAIVTGRVQVLGDRLVVGTELVDIGEGIQLWGDRFDRPAADLPLIQGDIARAIAENLRMQLTGDDEAAFDRRSTVDPEAYRLYLQGRFQCNSQREEGFNRAIEYYEEAIRLDPAFAAAHAGLGECYATLASYGVRPTADVLPQAGSYARGAIRLDESLPDAHIVLGMVHTWLGRDWAAAERAFVQAINLDPQSVRARTRYANLLTTTGRHEQAAGEFERALEVDPVSLEANLDLAWFFYNQRRFADARRQIDATLELDSANYNLRYASAIFYAAETRYDDALAEIERSLEMIDPGANDTDERAALGYIYGVMGRTDDARAILDELTALAEATFVRHESFAFVRTALGDTEEALTRLERAAQDGGIEIVVSVGSDPRFDPLRAEPRFGEILRDLNLPDITAR